MEEAFFCHKLFDTLLLHLHFHLPANPFRVQIDTRTLYDNLLNLCPHITYHVSIAQVTCHVKPTKNWRATTGSQPRGIPISPMVNAHMLQSSPIGGLSRATPSSLGPLAMERRATVNI